MEFDRTGSGTRPHRVGAICACGAGGLTTSDPTQKGAKFGPVMDFLGKDFPEGKCNLKFHMSHEKVPYDFP